MNNIELIINPEKNITDNNLVKELTKDLIRFRSEDNNPPEILAVLRYVQKLVAKNVGVKGVIRYIHDKPYLFIKARNNRKPYVLLNGHIDVIPADKEQYYPKIVGKWLYGRGGGDMKGGVAANILAFINNYKTGNIALLLNSDEELGGFEGAAILAKKIRPKPSLVIVSEPSDNKICLNEKGGLWVDINVKGPGGHASRPWTAKNCVDILIEIISELRKTYPILMEESWNNSMNIGVITGGRVVFDSKNCKIINGPANSIADNASVRLDFRLTEKTKHKDIMDKIDKIIKKKNRELGKEYAITSKGIEVVHHLHTDEKEPIIKIFVETHKEVLGTPVFKRGHAASDGRYFSAEGIPVILYGPISVGHHSSAEHVDIESIRNVYKVVDSFLKRL